MNKHKKLWMILAPTGLILIGAGLCMAIDAGFEKQNNRPFVLYGTFALIIFNSGISIFGRAVAEMILFKQKK